MEESKKNQLIENEREWRRYMLDTQTEQSKEIKGIKKEMSTLKVKVAGFASFFGMVGAYIKSKMGS